MCLSCNFVNVYTIAYRVQYTCIRVHARVSNGHPREEKRACRTKDGGQVGEDLRAEVGEDVRVGVGVRPMEFQLYATPLTSTDNGRQFMIGLSVRLCVQYEGRGYV